MRQLHCATCEAEMLFEAPPCADGHGDDCPELLCTGCGTAILLAPVIEVRAWLRSRSGSVAPRQRHAA
ncbi:hypothetical protein WEI85_18585 [Actinomycetes bacterium KLBMP 9797]